MVASFDTLSAAEAMESAGVESRQARAIAAQLHVAASTGYDSAPWRGQRRK